MYRAAQESLSNLIQHARATRIGMTLEAKGERLVLRVEDNGVGFDTPGSSSRLRPTWRRASGCAPFASRRSRLGGKLWSKAVQGVTRLEVSAP